MFEVDDTLGQTEEELLCWARHAITDRDQLDDAWASILRAEGVALANQHMEDEAKGRRQSAEFAKSRLKEAIRAAMEESGLKKLPCAAGVFARQGNGGKQPIALAEGMTPEAAPPEFVRTRFEFDLEKIGKALAEGEVIPFATLKERGEHLKLK